MLERIGHMQNGFYPMEHTRAEDSQWVTLVGFVVVLTIISAALFIVYKMATNSTAASQGKDPLDIAKERYAKGDISKDELADIKKELASK